MATARHGQWSTVVFVVDKVREQENYALASHHAHEVFERPADVCAFAGGTDCEKLTDDAQDVSFTFSGWDELFDVITEEQNPDFVVVANGRKGKCGCNLCDQITLCAFFRTELQGA